MDGWTDGLIYAEQVQAGGELVFNFVDPCGEVHSPLPMWEEVEEQPPPTVMGQLQPAPSPRVIARAFTIT